RREARGAAVLQRLDEAALDELDARLDQLLAGERIADLHSRSLVQIILTELLRREHGCAADTVAPGSCAIKDDQVAGGTRPRTCHALSRQDPDAHRVDETVVGVRLVEVRLAADGCDADRVALMAD